MHHLYHLVGVGLICVLCVSPYLDLFATELQWKFMEYFDDEFNFLTFPHLNSLVNSTNLLSHFYAIVSHKGINVYEPVSSFLKAFTVDVVGLNAHNLRIVSLFTHVANSSLLYVWLHLVLLNSKVYSSYWLLVSVALTCGMFSVHPLNVEVVGWLSAHGYLFSLFFALLSCIMFEYAWVKGTSTLPSPPVVKKVVKKVGDVTVTEDQVVKPPLSPAEEKLLDSVSQLLAGSLVSYAAAVMCKAPAIMLAPVLILRYLLHRLSNQHTSLHPSVSVMFLLYLSVLVVLAGVLVQVVLTSNETGSNLSTLSVVTSVLTSDKVILRTLYTLSLFVGRAFFPLDLRSHYTPPNQANYFTWSNLVSDPTLHLPILLFVGGSLLLVIRSLRFTFITIATGGNSSSSSGRSSSGSSSSGSSRGSKIQVLQGPPLLLLWGLLSYCLFWLPGVGIIEHGWSQLGADRYNYFPLAFVCPAVAYCLNCIGAISDSAVDAGSSTSKKQKAETSDDIRNVTLFYRATVCSLLGCLLFSFSHLSSRQLRTWQNDKLLLENCVRLDPKDWECNQYLGEWYGFHENNTELGDHYNILAIENIPTHSPKDLMFKARLLLGRDHSAACDAVRAAYSLCIRVDERGEYVVDTKNYDHYKVYPMVMNNLVTCDLLKNGITEPLAQTALGALQQVRKTIVEHPPKILTTEWKSVLNKLEEQIGSLSAWLKDHHKEYQAVFLW